MGVPPCMERIFHVETHTKASRNPGMARTLTMLGWRVRENRSSEFNIYIYVYVYLHRIYYLFFEYMYNVVYNKYSKYKTQTI